MTAKIKRDSHGIKTLYVDGKPFFAYAGEVHNSAASSLDYMKKEIWPKLQELNMNSVVVPVYWESLEPQPDQFDFSLVDGLIDQARQNNMRLILLWFGLWKNAESMYVPAWMKQDTKNYYRVNDVNGKPTKTISPFCQAAVNRDAHAFAELMSHLKTYDEEKSTVIMMQVENEIGVMGSARDFCATANEAFAQTLPRELADGLNLNPQQTWNEAFGYDADEQFMAWYFAKAVEKITETGQKEYSLPCYANSWLKQYPWYPGSYPMGGPVPDVQATWKIAAPSLAAFAPDIYVPYCADVMDDYASDDNPLFIPEIRKDAVAVSYCLYAFAAKNAIGFSPFGIEELGGDPNNVDRPPMEVMIALNIDPSAFDIAGSKERLAATYHLMHELEPLLLKYRGTNHWQSFVRHGENDYGTFLRFKNYDLQIAYNPRESGKPLGAGIIIELDDNQFLAIGTMCRLTFMPKQDENTQVDILELDEGIIENGQWKTTRVLNGDEKMSISFGDNLGSYRLNLYKF